MEAILRTGQYMSRGQVGVMGVIFLHDRGVARLPDRPVCLSLRLLRRMTRRPGYLVFRPVLVVYYQSRGLVHVVCGLSLPGAVCSRQSILLESADRRTCPAC